MTEREGAPRLGSVTPLEAGDPAQVGRYVLSGRLGAGGMGTVYLGRAAGGPAVAVKVVHPELAGDPEFRARFADEVAAARRVAPFCTARVVDADPDAATPYLVTEFVDGVPLSVAVAESGPLDPSTLHGVALGVAAALAAVHAAGVVHRDLKPGNVLLSLSGPRVIDFGIARALDVARQHTQVGMLVGTPGWMAPEQFRGGAVGPAADVFSWGSLVAYAATGRNPWSAVESGPSLSPAEQAHRILHGTPSLDGVGGSLRRLVESALAKDPARRPTARQLVDALLGGPAADPTRVAAGVVERTWTGLPTMAPGGPAPAPRRPDGPARPPASARPGAGPTARPAPGRSGPGAGQPGGGPARPAAGAGHAGPGAGPTARPAPGRPGAGAGPAVRPGGHPQPGAGPGRPGAGGPGPADPHRRAGGTGHPAAGSGGPAGPGGWGPTQVVPPRPAPTRVVPPPAATRVDPPAATRVTPPATPAPAAPRARRRLLRRSPPAGPVPTVDVSPRPRRRRWFLRKRLLVPLGLLALVVALAPEASTRPPASGSQLGKPVRDGNLEFVVDRVRCGVAKVGEGLVSRTADGQFCLADVRVRNVKTDARTLYEPFQKLVDSAGDTHSADIGARVVFRDQDLWDTVEPGTAVRGTMVFDIPKGVRAERLELHDGPISGGVTVRLR